MRATDRNGSTLDLRLRDIATKPSLQDSSFTFSPPAGVEVVDLRREQ
jgi:outer membrane lipoprotein-sorting protein